MVQILFLAIWILHKLYVPGSEPEKLAHIASSLELFGSRNQLAIELVPPGISTLGVICRRFGRSIALLRFSSIVGEVLELGAVQCLLLALSKNGGSLWVLGGNALVAVSALYTIDYISLVGVWLACLVVQVVLAFREIADRSKSLVDLREPFLIALRG